jgi:thioredoxin 1
MIAYITELTDSNFKEFINKEFVLVDVWATWCGPCKMIAPIIDEISADFVGKLSVGKLDADANRQTVTELGVKNIPTLLLFKNGKLVDKLVGAVSKQKLTDIINNQLIGT